MRRTIDVYAERVLSDPAEGHISCYASNSIAKTYLSINLLHVVVHSQFVTFVVSGDSSIGVTTHRDLMGLN